MRLIQNIKKDIKEVDRQLQALQAKRERLQEEYDVAIEKIMEDA